MRLTRNGVHCILHPPVHARTLVFLHGLGDSAESFADLFQSQPIADDCKYVLLTAPVRPVTINGGMQMTSWYDIPALGTRSVNAELRESAEFLAKVIEEERQLTDNIVIGGFSQGGAVSLYTALSHYAGSLKGVIGLSTYLMEFEPRADCRSLPIFLYHGEADDLIRAPWALSSYEVLEGFNTTLITEPTLGHSLSSLEIDRMREWLTGIF